MNIMQKVNLAQSINDIANHMYAFPKVESSTDIHQLVTENTYSSSMIE